MKFLDLFERIAKGNFGLTEEAAYKSIQLGNRMIPLWGGNQEHVHADRFVDEKAKTIYDQPIRVFHGEGIIISLDGSAGSMTYKRGERFALNHHAGFFEAKGNSDRIDPKFFSIFYQQQLREATVSAGSKTLTLDAIYAMDFEIPSRPAQRELMTQMRPVLDRQWRIRHLLRRVASLKSRTLSVEYGDYQARGVPVSRVFACMGGNSGLTEKEIYQTVCTKGQRYQVLSGSTLEEKQLGSVPLFHLNGRPIRVFSDKEGILVVRKGKAGSARFLKRGKYALTDDAYILYLRSDCPYQVQLKWFAIQHAPTFLEYVSTSDNGTWNMTGFFENVVFDIPDIAGQKMVITGYESLEAEENRLREMDTKIDAVFMRIFAD